MPDKEREIEAVARALTDHPDEWDDIGTDGRMVFRRMAADGIAALDRLRDARRDDEGKRDIMDVFRSDEAMRAFGVERPAQGEDHETEAVGALYEFARERWGSHEYEDVRDAVAVVLSRVSPSRDGTVAVEDVAAKLNEMALVDETRDPHDEGYMAAVVEVRDWLAEFARSATGEQTDHGGDQ